MGRGVCLCFSKHLLLILLVWETGTEGPSCVAASVPCVSFSDDDYSHVPAAAAGIFFQPSHLLTPLPSTYLHLQLADLSYFLFPSMWRLWGHLVFWCRKELIKFITQTFLKIN